MIQKRELNYPVPCEQLYYSKEFADVTLVSDDQVVIQAHKAVLSSSSPVIRNFLLDNPHPLIFFNGVSHKELEPILILMYFGEIALNEGDVGRFLEILSQMEIKSPKEVDKVDTANKIADSHVINLQENIDDTSDIKKMKNKKHKTSNKSTRRHFEMKQAQNLCIAA